MPSAVSVTQTQTPATSVWPAPNPVFDQLFASAVPKILDGTHQRDEPPVDGGRWPVTVLARPSVHVRQHLDALMREALEHAGPRHFVTGRTDSVHLTIRALEPYRDSASPQDAIVADWRGAMERVASRTQSFALACTGVTLTTGGVMAQVETLDDRPWQLMDELRAELGALAWYEDGWMRRNIWYASLVHFAADVLDPAGLVTWAAGRRSTEPVEFTVSALELVRSRYVEDGSTGERLMRPESWFEVPFTSTESHAARDVLVGA